MENPKPDRWGTAVRSPFGAGPRNAGGFHPHQGPRYRYPKRERGLLELFRQTPNWRVA